MITTTYKTMTAYTLFILNTLNDSDKMREEPSGRQVRERKQGEKRQINFKINNYRRPKLF